MESSLGIFFKGYNFFHHKFEKQQKDLLETRLMLRRTTVIKGKEAAKIFYDREKFQREGATPGRFKKTLLGEGGVQGLDREAHLYRKKMFMEVMDPDSRKKLEDHFRKFWKEALEGWQNTEEIVLFKEVEKILLRAACAWTGVPLPKKEVEKRTQYFSKMIDGSGGAGPRHWKGRAGRKKAEKWIKKLVKKTRKKNKTLPDNSILSAFAFHQDHKGKLLKNKIVAVEIINLLRPIVAIARYIVFAAHALHKNPHYRNRLKKNMSNLDLHFVQEVRRFYPFFPFVAAIVKKPFEWNGVNFPQGRRVLLDIYATLHDNSAWSNSDTFYAERFQNWDGSAFNFIPQGGGDHYKNHRCAGEWITIDLTRVALDFLVNEMIYTVPEQNLKIDMSRIPAIPKSRFRIAHISRKE